MKNGERIPWSVTAFCETFKVSCLTGKLFHLMHWLNIIQGPRKTSRESTSFVTKYYLAYSSVTSCTRRECGWTGNIMVVVLEEL